MQNSAYNAQVDEYKVASYALKSFSGMPYEKYADTACGMCLLRSTTSTARSCPTNWRKRAEHFYIELVRAEAGAESIQ